MTRVVNFVFVHKRLIEESVRRVSCGSRSHSVAGGIMKPLLCDALSFTGNFTDSYVQEEFRVEFKVVWGRF